MKPATYISIILLSLFCISAEKGSEPSASFILTKVKVECITQCDATGSDQVFVTIPASSINHKISSTRSFLPGNIKTYTEIGPNNGSASTAWFIKPGDKIQVFEKDLLDPNDLIKEISVTSAICNGQLQVVTGINGKGKYRISFTIAVI